MDNTKKEEEKKAIEKAKEEKAKEEKAKAEKSEKAEKAREEKAKAEKAKAEKAKAEKLVANAQNSVSTNSKKSVLRNVLGKEVPEADYFYKGIVPSGFKGTCGEAVTREDLVKEFHKVFKPGDNILFYKQLDKEVYLVIVPIRNSVSIGDFNDSVDGDFQKHAISFLNEGSVNIDTLKQKLERIKKFVKYDDR